MKHGYFLILHEKSFRRQDGIGKKMRAQIQTLTAAGLACEPYFFRVNREMETLSVWGKAAYLLPFANFSPRWEYDAKLAQADFLYFRHPPAVTGPMCRVLRRLKAKNPALRVVMEIPTYPYEGELRGPGRLLLAKDRYHRQRLGGAVDALAVIGDIGEERTLWGLPVLRVVNGCRVADICPAQTREDGCIDLIAVARFARWHGFDRLLRGLGAYCRAGGERNVRVHLVGESQDGTLEEYRRLTAQYGLGGRVLFHGFQSGAALDALYDACDIGVTTMGFHRKAIRASSDLKSREYLAKGLPVVGGTQVDIFTGHTSPWYCEFPADESDIDIERIVAFYDEVYPAGGDRAQRAAEIRHFAGENCDMSVTFRPVVDFLKTP